MSIRKLVGADGHGAVTVAAHRDRVLGRWLGQGDGGSIVTVVIREALSSLIGHRSACDNHILGRIPRHSGQSDDG